MSDDVFDKLDALLKKHAANEPEIPVLTDLVEPPSVDLNAIPVVTEEITAEPFAALLELELELDFIPEPMQIIPSSTRKPKRCWRNSTPWKQKFKPKWTRASPCVNRAGSPRRRLNRIRVQHRNPARRGICSVAANEIEPAAP